jgi:hypothetical protein
MTDHGAPDAATGLAAVEASPTDIGRLRLIVRRPGVGEREVLEAGRLSVAEGLVGDTWHRRSSKRTPDGSPHPDMQLNIMNARAAELFAGGVERWPLAGDQLYVDLDLSVDNLPTGTLLHIGDSVVEVTDQPHTGCAKFSARFGVDALRLVNSPDGSRLRLRGINARVVQEGSVSVGDEITVTRPSGT